MSIWPALTVGPSLLRSAAMPLIAMVAQNLRVLRLERKLSQPKPAGKAGLSTYYISRLDLDLERGKERPKLRTLGALVNALGVAAADLLSAGTIERTNPAGRA
jgi:transcriptional regulator with XRE-family HTH domain